MVRSVSGPLYDERDDNRGRFFDLLLVRGGEPSWFGGHDHTGVAGAEFLREARKREVRVDAVFNNLYKLFGEVEGDCA